MSRDADFYHNLSSEADPADSGGFRDSRKAATLTNIPSPDASAVAPAHGSDRRAGIGGIVSSTSRGLTANASSSSNKNHNSSNNTPSSVPSSSSTTTTTTDEEARSTGWGSIGSIIDYKSVTGEGGPLSAGFVPISSGRVNRPPLDRQDSTAVALNAARAAQAKRAARAEAEYKEAALRQAVVEEAMDRRNSRAGGSGRGGGRGRGGGHGREESIDMLFAVGGGSGTGGGSLGNNVLLADTGFLDGVVDADPPILPSGETLEVNCLRGQGNRGAKSNETHP